MLNVILLYEMHCDTKVNDYERCCYEGDKNSYCTRCTVIPKSMTMSDAVMKVTKTVIFKSCRKILNLIGVGDQNFSYYFQRLIFEC